MTKKFRVWDLVGEKWMDVFEVNLLEHDYLNNPEYQIQQWTGLTDSQGVEIYEGDIVSTIYPEYKTAKVFFCINSGSFRLLSGNVALPMVTMRTQGGQSPKLINVFEKVIGNIFQTPELLEKCSE